MIYMYSIYLLRIKNTTAFEIKIRESLNILLIDFKQSEIAMSFFAKYYSVRANKSVKIIGGLQV